MYGASGANEKGAFVVGAGNAIGASFCVYMQWYGYATFFALISVGAFIDMAAKHIKGD